MENTFLNNEPERFAMNRFCDLLHNITDRNIANRNIALITISQYRWSVAYDNHPLTCFPRNAICDMHHRISAV